MAQRRFHYDRAFEAYLRSRRVPYVAVDEAKKALLPDGRTRTNLKSFDFVIYGQGRNLIVDVKGRKCASRQMRSGTGRLDNWVTRDDVESLAEWERLFGDGFAALFVFLYWCVDQPPDGLFQEVFQDQGRWYAVRAVGLPEYTAHMRTRSERWKTVHVPSKVFETISHPFCPSAAGGCIGEAQCDPSALQPL
ncbi:MAG: HYExAFE family protein [Phycisphaerales bacterium]|nr:HYExAFE family protein [Phycisphaerales bacterium]